MHSRCLQSPSLPARTTRSTAAASRRPCVTPQKLVRPGASHFAYKQQQHHKQQHHPVCCPASASAAPGWPGDDANTTTAPASSNSNDASSTQQQQQQQPQQHNPLAAALAAIWLAARSAPSRAADSASSAARRLARLQVWLGKPEALLFREGCQLLACLMFILLYVWSTYSPVVPGGGRWWLDLVLSLLFAADYLHRTLTSSKHPLLAVLHPLALIDLLSFAPSLLGALLPEYGVAPWGLDLRWFRVFRALRLLRLSLLSGNLSTMKTNRGVLIAGNLNVPLVWLVASVVAWMFTSASCVAVMEKLPWHDALYFVGSTLTTVGYGDVVVKSSAGRLFVLVMMLVGVVLIPVRASQLYSRLSERLLMVGNKPGESPGCAGGYVVLSGRLSDVRGFNDFLSDFNTQVRALSAWRPSAPAGPSAAASGGTAASTTAASSASSHPQGLQLVCLCNKPSVEFLALQELHESHLTLVEGSAFNERDLLHRAGLPASLGALVLADRFSSNATAEDTDVQFRVWAIKSAVKRLPLYVQVLRRSSVDVISPFLDPYLDVIMSVEGTRMRLLALSTLVPGASTLIANLLRSSGPNAGFAGGRRHHTSSRVGNRVVGGSDSPVGSSTDSLDEGAGGGPLGLGWQKLQAAVRSLDDVMLSHAFSSIDGSGSNGSSGRPGDMQQWQQRQRHRVGSAGAGTELLAGRRWLREYADGAHCELFLVPAGPPLAGLRFAGAASAVYEATGALVVGLIEVGSQRLLLNPSSHTIHQEQQLVVLAATHQTAQAAAAGYGVEAVLFSQALRAAQVEAAAAADAIVEAADVEAVATTAGTHELHYAPSPAPAAAAAAAQHSAQHSYNQQQEQQQLPSVAAAGQPAPAHTSSSSSSSVDVNSKLRDSRLTHASLSSVDGGSRAVTVRVPESLASELSSSSSSSNGWAPQHPPSKRQFAEQQPLVHHWQQQQQHTPPLAAAGAAFAADGHYHADAYAAFEQHKQESAATPPAAAGGVRPDSYGGGGAGSSSSSGGGGMTADDLIVAGCLAPWSGAFESDSIDETELCTDSELEEAALLQQQAYAQRLQRVQEQQEQELQEQQQEPQTWLMMSSFDSSSMQPKREAETTNGSGGGGVGSSSSSMPSAVPAAGSVSSSSPGTPTQPPPQQQQQQQQPVPPPAPPQGRNMPVLPATSQLRGHFILAGCASSFVQFTRQLAASAPPEAEPLTVVLLHPEYPALAADAIRRMGVRMYHVSGRSSDAAALHAAGANSAHSLVYLGPSERPTHLPAAAVSGMYGDPTSTREGSHADLSGSSRTAVLADADALSSCYGVGEVFQPNSLSTIIELGFTSSIRFLQPGLLLHGRPAPHSSSSFDEGQSAGGAGGGSLDPAVGGGGIRLFLGGLLSGWAARVLRGSSGNQGDASSSGRNRSRSRSHANSPRSSIDGGSSRRQDYRRESQGAQGEQSFGDSAFLATGSPALSRAGSPPQQHQQQQHSHMQPDGRQQHQQQQHQQRDGGNKQQQPLSWPWQQQLGRQHKHSKLPRSSWRHRKEIEEAGQLEGLTEWQLNSYYAAGRVMVPALLDVFTVQGFFKRQALLDLMTELTGDDGRPGGAMLQQQPVPLSLVGCYYAELVQHYLSSPDPQQRYVPIGLLRKKAENRAWRLPYVATHPHPDTLLLPTDLVFVIRPQ